MATVYLAEDLKHGRKVAIKVLHPELSAVLGSERFLAEIKVTANLQHPHILGLIDSGEADGLLYYVMPYVAGESLRARLHREKQLPVDEAAAARPGSRVRARLRPSPGRGPPRHQAGEHAAAGRRGAGRRLRHRPRRAAGRRQPHDPDRDVARHAGLHVARAGDGRAGDRPAERRVRARRDDLRDARRRAALHRAQLAGDRRQGAHRAAASAPAQAADRAPAAESAILTALQKLPADRWGTAREFSDALAESASSRARPAPRPYRCPRHDRAAAGGSRAAFLRLGWPAAVRRRGPRRLGSAPAAALSFPRRASRSWRPDWAAAARARRSGTWRSCPTARPWCTRWSAPTAPCAWCASRSTRRPRRRSRARSAWAVRWCRPTAATWWRRSRSRARCCACRSMAAAPSWWSGRSGSDDGALAPDGSLWFSSGSPTSGRSWGTRSCQRLRGRQYQLQQILPDGRTALAVRDAGRQPVRPRPAGGPRDRRRDPAPGHAGHRGAGDPGPSRLRDAGRQPAGRAVRSSGSAGSTGRR